MPAAKNLVKIPLSRANGVMRVEGLENKICPEDGGGIEINMS